MVRVRGSPVLLRCLLGLTALIPAVRAREEDPAYHAQTIFIPEDKCTHASCVIETAGGNLLATESADFAAAIDRALGMRTEDEKTKYRGEIADFSKRSRDLLYQRLGWMPRVHPIALPSGR